MLPLLTSASAPPAGVWERAIFSSCGVQKTSQAKNSGMVWVNTESGVYHSPAPLYGRTKQAKYMTEGDAIKAAIKGFWKS